MTYEEWLQSVPAEITEDLLWRMEVYRFALFADDLAWFDVCKLVQDQRTAALSDQLYRAMGSVAANVAEGYSRLLMTIIPHERGFKLAEEKLLYEVDRAQLLNNVPLP